MSKYAIVGSGGLGGFYGGCLARAGHDVHFIIRDNVEIVRSQGWIVESKWGDFTIDHPNVYSASDEAPNDCDFVIVAIKSTQNEELANLLPPLIGSHTIAIVLQNGLDVERDTERLFGEGKVLGGCCFLCSQKVGPGHIRHLDYGRIELGAYRCSNSEALLDRSRSDTQLSSALETVSRDFQHSNIPVEVLEDLRRARWRKLMWNIPFNGLSVALDASTAQIMSQPHARQLARDLMDETQQAANAIGIDVGSTHADTLMANTDKMVPYDSSMRLDYLAKRRMELKYIFENPILAARSVGFEPSRIAMLHQQLCFLESMNQPHR